MTFDFALEYIPGRMNELGYENGYHLRLKYINLAPNEIRVLEAYNQLILVVIVGNNMKVESDMGVIDYSDNNLRNYEFEHTGLVTITNKGEAYSTLQFIQVIPKKIPDACNQR
jgi:hypothetical protein